MATTIRRLILERIAELGETSLDVFFPAKYPEAQLWRQLLGSHKRPFSRRSFSAMLSQLRSQGLVERRGTRWRMSPAGQTHLREPRYVKQLLKPDGVKRLVIFDIPERFKAKRNAIRAELISYGYHQLQKSVWLGTAPLPPDFLVFLDELQLKPYVHLFSVRNAGTL